ncbi:sigma-70 family RNA polymerase sigma factor [Gordonia sp. CPCC 205515]|uniref:sigma-70 family RNA polymerase sigma factor n=1 Tax=Gordonia sp. CPCC 205515 TaxID=3140791 RepID=UPI003AF3F001
MDETEVFAAERPRLLRIAERIVGDRGEAEDIVQQAWLRLHRTDTDIENLPAWLTTVTTRLCLDRLRATVPTPEDDLELDDQAADPSDEIALADTVGIALQVVLDRLTPNERVAFVLHDTFGVDFATVAAILGASPAAARKLASRARAKITQPGEPEQRTDWAIVDAFLDAARNGEFAKLLELLAPEVVIEADAAAIATGTPARMEGRDTVAQFFNGAAKAALSVFIGGRPGACWFDKGQARVAFDFTVDDGRVSRIVFRADPEVLAQTTRRRGGDPR